MELMYVTSYDYAQQEKFETSIRASNRTSSRYSNWVQMLDAKTGEWIGYDGKKLSNK
ncbi:hypothetical protein KHA80_12875 [Anaerobacillus sp. HL2]|nr:hypothetical protein KHA80_12875 [Anaerobacillus sp. HL2]